MRVGQGQGKGKGRAGEGGWTALEEETMRNVGEESSLGSHVCGGCRWELERGTGEGRGERGGAEGGGR